MDSAGTILKAMWTTMRPYLLFVSAITGVAGVAMSPTPSAFPLLAIFIASFFAYGFGQALTDCFQTDTDAISAPYRPLASGAVSRTPILFMSVIGLTICAAVYALFNLWNVFLGLLATTGLATYTTFKRRWWGGPWYNAWIVVTLCVMGFLAGTGNTPPHFGHGFVPMLGTVFFGYANFVLAGYFKDISADRATGYFTLPVVFGRKAATYVSDALAAAFLAAGVWTASVSLDSSPQPLVLIAGLLFGIPGFVHVVSAQAQLHRNNDDATAYSPILHVVHGYILVLSGLAAILRPDWTILLIVHYAAFTIVLARRPEVTQI